MKAIKITYYVTTGIISLMMLYSAYAYLALPVMLKAFQHLGYPGYFRIELAIIKILGVIGLLAPVHGKVKEWVYAGFTITFVSAFIAHISSGDPVSVAATPIIFLVLLAASYITYSKLQKAKQHNQASK